MLSKTFNLTPMRLRALRMVQQKPGMLASGLAELCEKQSASWRAKPFNGFDLHPSSAAAATRWGARYAQLMIEQGLMRYRHSDVGWGMLYLTSKGQEVARTGEMPESS